MTPKLAAAVVSLVLLSLIMLFVPLLLIGCDPGPEQKCDYCRAIRHGVQRFVCDKCKKPHAACESERSLLNYTKTEGIRGAIYYSATSLLTCPAPSEGPEPVAETPKPEDPQDPKTPTSVRVLMALALITSFFIGFAAGKARRGHVIKLENKNGVVS